MSGATAPRDTRSVAAKRMQETAGDEERQTKKRSEASEPQRLEYIDAASDKLDDAAHAALDVNTRELLSKFGDEPNAFTILMGVASTCDRLDSQRLVKISPDKALTRLAQDAHRTGNYKSIRNLTILQKEGIQTKSGTEYTARTYFTDRQKNAVKKAWTTPYMGKGHELLYQTITEMNRTRSLNPYANSLSIIQSSGTGKSRAVHELGKLVFAIPFNLRSSEDEKGFPYPLPDTDIRDYLVSKMLNGLPNRSESVQVKDSKLIAESLHARLYYINFLHNLFAAVLEEVKALPRVDGLQKVAESWSAHLEQDGVRNKLYDTVIGMPYSGRLNSVYEAHGYVEDEFGYMAEKTSRAIESLISQINELANISGTPSTDIRIVISFDEAHILTNTFVRNESGVEVNLYHAFCNTTSDDCILKAPIFFLYLSTHSNLGKFAPPQWQFPSARIYGGKDTIQAPFTELPFDILKNQAPIIESGTKTLEEVSDINFMCSFGRPLFKSLVLSDRTMERSVIDLARSKLVGNSDPDMGTMLDNAKLAVLAIRLLPDFNLARAHTRLALVGLVQSHMAIAYSIPQHRETLRTGYPSEPILAEAAARQMRVMRSTPGEPESAASILLKFTESGLIKKGERGELVARLILTLAYDEAVDAFNKDSGTLNDASSGNHPLYSRGVPVKYYMKALLGEKHAENVFKSHPNNVKGGKTFEEAYKDAWVRFTHFQLAGDSSVINSEGCWAAAARAMAYQCSSGQPMIDILIPILLRKDLPLCEANMTAMLIQVKARRAAVPEATVEIDEKGLDFFPVPSDDRPYITIVMELGVQFSTEPVSTRVTTDAPDVFQTPSKVIVKEVAPRASERIPTIKKHPRYAIIVRGCSPSVYGVVTSKSVYASLLASRHILDEHPRQTPEALSAIKRFKSFWSSSPECFDWIASKKLNTEKVSKETAEGVITGDALPQDVFT